MGTSPIRIRYACWSRCGPSRARTATDWIVHEPPATARLFPAMARPSLAQQDERGHQADHANSVTRPGSRGRADEGHNERGPPFDDCARMVHKTANVLDKLPKGSQPKAKRMLHDIYQAESRAKADKAFDLFMATYEAKPEVDPIG